MVPAGANVGARMVGGGTRVLAREWVAAVDLGTTKATALVGRHGPAGWRLAGHGHASMRGVEKGAVTDPEAAARSVRLALERAFAGLGLSPGGADGAPAEGDGPVPAVFLGVAGESILDEPVTAEVDVDQGRVRPEHVEQCAGAIAASSGPTRATLHVLGQAFAVQPGKWLDDPVGRPGARLRGRARLVTSTASQVAAIRKTAEGAPLAVADLILNAIAAGWSVLDSDERAAGTAVVDFGGGTLDVALFAGGGPARVASLPLGSGYITADLAIGLGIPWAAAESLKCRHARVDGALVQRVVEVPGQGGMTVELPLVDEIVSARADEILERAEPVIREMREEVGLPGGVVLTGGGVALRGLPKRAMEIWNVPVRVGTPRPVEDRFQALATPGAAAAMGLLDLARRSPLQSARSVMPAMPMAVAMGRRLVAWLSGLV